LGSFARDQPISRPASPPPFGFSHNRGRDYVPFHIIRRGQRIPAQYTTLVMCDNPYVLGRIDGDTTIYGGLVEAEPDYDVDHIPTYTRDQLVTFTEDSAERPAIDAGLHILADNSLTAEVHRFRRTTVRLSELNTRILQLERRMFELGRIKSASSRALERANALDRIDRVGLAPVSQRDTSAARREEQRRVRRGRPT
jgi:hypothetical protein